MIKDDVLEIVVPEKILWDERKEEFVKINETKIEMKHSLISISKWEKKWKVPYLSNDKKTSEMVLDYIRCMTLNKVDDDVYYGLTEKNMDEILAYISDPMTATVCRKEHGGTRSRETITSELIYYWMISYNIPEDYQKWHLNRLMTLIRVCAIKNAPPKKRSKREILANNAELNAKRREMMNTKG